MFRRSRQLLITAALLAGCADKREVAVDVSGAHTFIVLIEDLDVADPVARFIAAEVTTTLGPFTEPPGNVRITIYAYVEAADVLGLVPGPLAFVGEGTARRGLPRPSKIHGGVDGDWKLLDEAPAEVLALRIPVADDCPTFTTRQVYLPESRGHVRHLAKFGGRALYAATSYYECDPLTESGCLPQSWRSYRVSEGSAELLPDWIDQKIYVVATAPGESVWVGRAGSNDVVRFGRESSGDPDSILDERDLPLDPGASPAALASLDDDSELWAVTSSGAVYRYDRDGAAELISTFPVGRGHSVSSVYPVERGHAFVIFESTVVEYRPDQAPRSLIFDADGITFQHLNVIPDLGYVISSESNAALGKGAFFTGTDANWHRIPIEGELPTILESNAPQQVVGFAGGYLAPADGGKALFMRQFNVDQDGRSAPLTLGLCREINLGAGNYYHAIVIDPRTIVIAGRQSDEQPDPSKPASVFWVTVD